MSNIYEDLVKFFGNQKSAAKALGVKQGSVSGWVTLKHGMSETKALLAEKLTKGQFIASELCPRLKDVA